MRLCARLSVAPAVHAHEPLHLGQTPFRKFKHSTRILVLLCVRAGGVCVLTYVRMCGCVFKRLAGGGACTRADDL